MKLTDRRFQQRFIDLLELHDGWPSNENLRRWAEDTATTLWRNDVYRQMRDGCAIAPRHAAAFCAYVLSQHGKPAHKNLSNAVTTYLAERGTTDLNMSPEELAEQFLVGEPEADYMALEAAGLMSMIAHWPTIPTAVCQCANERDVREAISWQFIAGGRSLLSDRTAVSRDEAVARAEEHFGITLERFQERAISWWKFDRWTVAFARGKYHRTGMNVVLPLTEDAYQAMRSGERQGYEVSHSELCRPSRFLLIPCTAESSALLVPDEGDITRYTFLAILSQIGALSGYKTDDLLKPINTLSFAASPLSEQRLRKARYKPLGVKMPGRDIELFERRLMFRPRFNDTALRIHISYLQIMYRDALRPPKYNR